MSLNIYFKDVDAPTENVIWDAEMAFYLTKIWGDAIDKTFVKSIDKGTLVDQYWFTDRFGTRLRTDYLSTGCKVAIAVHNNPDLIISCLEAGYNVFTEIVRNCSTGNIIVFPDTYYFKSSGIAKIDVVCRGHHFLDPQEFGEYIMNDAPYEVEDDDEGDGDFEFED